MRVMISSTVIDLPEHRAAAKDAVERMSMTPRVMEKLPAGSGNALERSMRLVDESDLYVCILAERYGTIAVDSDRSYTHLELERARDRKIPVVVLRTPDNTLSSGFEVAPPSLEPRIAALRTWAHETFGSDVFMSVDDLRAQIVIALHDRLTHMEQPTPPPASLPSLPEPYVVHPYLLTGDDLVGRDDALDQLSAWYEADADPIMQVEALGGVGKSALIWHWFHHRAPRRSGAGRFWWSFYQDDIRIDNLVDRALAYFTQRPLTEVRTLPGLDREEQLLAALASGPHLLVLDGLERATRAYASDDDAFVADAEIEAAPKSLWALGGTALSGVALQQTRQLRRTADLRLGSFLRRLTTISGAKVLISTRNPSFDLESDNSEPLPGVTTMVLPGLADDDALALWKAVAGKSASPEVARVLASTDNHPLFIRSLAAEIRDFRGAPGDYAAWQLAHPAFEPLAVLGGHPRKRHVLEYAMTGLDDAARLALKLIAEYPGQVSFPEISPKFQVEFPRQVEHAGGSQEGRRRDSPGTILEQVPWSTPGSRQTWPSRDMRRKALQVAELDRALKELEERGLVGWDRRTNTYDLHPLVRGVTRAINNYQPPTIDRFDRNYRRHTDWSVTIVRRADLPSVDPDGLTERLPLSAYFGPTEDWARVIESRWLDPPPGLQWSPGVTKDGPLYVDLRTSYHLTVTGRAGSGKTEALVNLAVSLCANYPPTRVGLVFVGGRGSPIAREIAALPHAVAVGAGPSRKSLANLTSLLRSIEKERTEQTVREGAPATDLVVVADEFESLEREAPEFTRLLADLIESTRPIAMHVITSTRQPTLAQFLASFPSIGRVRTGEIVFDGQGRGGRFLPGRGRISPVEPSRKEHEFQAIWAGLYRNGGASSDTTLLIEAITSVYDKLTRLGRLDAL